MTLIEALLTVASRPLPTITLEQMEYLIGPNGEQKEGLERRKAEVGRVEAARPAFPGRSPLLLGRSQCLRSRGYGGAFDDSDAVAAGRARLSGDGRPNPALKRFTSLNHLFMTGQRPPSPAEYDVPGHVDAAVIDAIAGLVGG